MPVGGGAPVTVGANGGQRRDLLFMVWPPPHATTITTIHHPERQFGQTGQSARGRGAGLRGPPLAPHPAADGTAERRNKVEKKNAIPATQRESACSRHLLNARHICGAVPDDEHLEISWVGARLLQGLVVSQHCRTGERERERESVRESEGQRAKGGRGGREVEDQIVAGPQTYARDVVSLTAGGASWKYVGDGERAHA